MNFKTISAVAVAMVSTTVFAGTACDGSLLPLELGHFEPTIPTVPVKKFPIQIPLVYQDGPVLTFATPCTGCTLQLLDADGDIVYETEVAADTTTVTIPALAGTYELRLIYGGYYFYADIDL